MSIAPPSDIHTEAALLDQVEILGRKSELRQFLKALTLCRTGQGKAIYLTGNEGIGKTAILETFLNLAENAYGCRPIRLMLPHRATPQLLFAQIVEEILGLSKGILLKSLNDANQILQPLGLRWTQGDLMRIIALMRLQESVGNRHSFAVEQLSQSILNAIPFFKRFNTPVNKQVEALAQILVNPWVTMAVSLVNPINPQVQQAIALVEQIMGRSRGEMPLLLASSFESISNAVPPDTMTQAAITIEPKADDAINEDDTPAESLENTGDALPTVSMIQAALVDLLTFINSGLRDQQSAFILAFDQWEMLLDSPENVQKDMKDFFSEVLRQTVEQRNFRLMLIISCRSEAESYAIGGSLFNALKVKYLVPPLVASAQQKFLKERFKSLQIQCDESVIQELTRLCNGNPAWLKLMSTVIEADFRQSGLQVLDLDTYHERYSVSRPLDLVELLFTRLQLGFVGEESAFTKALGKLITGYAGQDFKKSQVIWIMPEMIDRLLDALVQQHFLSVSSSHEGEPQYRFFSAFMSTYLKQKTSPIQEDMPTPDKVASLRKVLPMTIQSGELTKEKTQELLAMASTLDNPELIQFMEQTMIEALQQESTPLETQLSLLESLALLGSASSIQTLLSQLESGNAAIRESVCLQLMPLINRPGLSVPRKALVEAVIPLLNDPVPPVRYQAYQLLSICTTEEALLKPLFIQGAMDSDGTIRLLSVMGLEHLHSRSADVYDLYNQILQETQPEINLFKAALKGLQHFDKDKVVPVLRKFLDNHAKTPLGSEVLMTLMNLDMANAMPWISSLLEDDLNPELKRSIIKRLGSRPNPDAEKILVNLLRKHTDNNTLLPELRWITIRSLGWIGNSKEALRVLESQHSLCQNDEILVQALQSAIRQLSERVSGFGEPQQEEDENQNAGGTRYLPISGSLAESAKHDSPNDAEEEAYIDLVAASAEN